MLQFIDRHEYDKSIQSDEDIDMVLCRNIPQDVHHIIAGFAGSHYFNSVYNIRYYKWYKPLDAYPGRINNRIYHTFLNNKRIDWSRIHYRNNKIMCGYNRYERALRTLKEMKEGNIAYIFYVRSIVKRPWAPKFCIRNTIKQHIYHVLDTLGDPVHYGGRVCHIIHVDKQINISLFNIAGVLVDIRRRRKRVPLNKFRKVAIKFLKKHVKLVSPSMDMESI